MKIEILNPFQHDHVYYDRGVHDVPDEVAREMLKHKHVARLAHETAPVTASPVAVEKPRPLQEGTLQNIEQLLRKQAGATAAPAPAVPPAPVPELTGADVEAPPKGKKLGARG